MAAAQPAWPRTPEEALAVQLQLREHVVRHDAMAEPVRRVAGVDVAYAADESRVFAVAVVLDADTLQPVAEGRAERPVSFPYVPGLFAFRELPAVLEALRSLGRLPDLVVCDGQGLAHPRRFGFASHLGVLLDVPTLGAAKTRLCGTHDEPGEARGSHVPLMEGGEVVGAVLRTRDGVKPLYVSIGHRIGLATAIQWVLRLTPRYRLPETTRLADQACNAWRRSSGAMPRG